MIRKATQEDIFRLCQLKPSLTKEVIKERLTKQNKGEVEFLVLEKNKQIISFILLKWFGKGTHPDYPDIEDLFTRKSYRGKGYATQLIAECERKAKEKGFTKVGLAVNPSLNTYAKRFYEKLGYKHDGKQSYIDGVYNGVEDWCIDMEKPLI
jgi:GNAT superfamily N-acetyltransferase